MSFLSSSLDLFLGKRCSHMGAYQYSVHAGSRNGRSTSGAALWAEAEGERNRSEDNMVSAETALMKTVTSEIRHYVPLNTTVVELGPGTTAAFQRKTLPIIRALQSKRCVLVDQSVAFLKAILADTSLGAEVSMKHFLADFFQTEEPYCCDKALVCSFGSTISNILHPIDRLPPKQALIDSLRSMAKAAQEGWMIVGVDCDQDGESIKTYFRNHALFQLNIFDRMAAELPLSGFDPLAFDYEPEWFASSGQLAHVAVVNRDMEFTLAGKRVLLGRGQKLHIKNSYKFDPEFFEVCCLSAGLDILHIWPSTATTRIYLLGISAGFHAMAQIQFGKYGHSLSKQIVALSS